MTGRTSLAISDDDLLQRIGVLINKRATYLDAQEPLEEAWDRRIGNPPAICNLLAVLYTYKGQFSKASNILEQIEPSITLGNVYFLEGRYEDAQSAYEIATRAAPLEPGKPTALVPGGLAINYFGELSANVDAALRADQLGLLPPHNELTLPSQGRFADSTLRKIWAQAGVGVGDAVRHKIHVDVMPIADGRLLPRVLAHATYRTGRPLISMEWESTHWDFLKLRRGDPFVVMHVRENASYEEDEIPWTPNKFRNADPMTYVSAVEHLTSLGVKVFRIGDKSMSAMPSMPGFFDLATLPDPRPDWVDVFLAANALFFLATASGPYTLAYHFGTPILGTNWFPLGWWLYDDNQMLIHKTFKKRSMPETMKPPWFTNLRPDILDPEETVIDNTSDEILEAVKIMLNRPATASPTPPAADPLGIGFASRLAYPEHRVMELWG